MNQQTRREIEAHAQETYVVALEEMAEANAKDWLRTQHATSALHNRGAYAHAYTEFKAGEVRKHVLAFADALVTTLDMFGVPSDADFVNFLDLSAKQMTGGAIAAVNGQLNLLESRTRIHITDRGGINQSITMAMHSAVRAGKLRLNNQRIRFNKGINEGVRSPSPAEDLKQAALNSLRGVLGSKYANWLATSWGLLESVVALREPKHLTLEEQDALKFPRILLSERFDEVATREYNKWLEDSAPRDNLTAKLNTVKVNLLSSSLRRWSLGSEDLRDWYVAYCQRHIEAALDDRLQRWDHRARTAEIVRHVRADRGEELTRLIEKLSQLSSEENQTVPNLEDRRRVRAWVHPTEYRVEGGYSGEFLERARLAIADIGAHLNVGMSQVPPLDFCLRILLRELVCEREPLNNPQVARLNSAQLGRYLWAPISGDSNTPDSGQLLSLCESLGWYGRRLLGLLNFSDARSPGSDAEDSPKSSRPFVPAEVAGPPPLPRSDATDEIKSPAARKRGRPSQIPEERKLLALSATGNRNRAQILYGTKFPSPQQVKNVSSILRHYQRKSRQAE